MKCLVVLSTLAALVLSEAEPDAQSGLLNNIELPVGLPYGLGYGGVSSTNVNVPGKFSYVVNSVHPTTDSEDMVTPTEAVSPALNYLPAGYGYNPYYGLRSNFYNPWASGIYSMGMGRINPYYRGYPYGMGFGLRYPYGSLGYIPAPAATPLNEE